MRRKFTAVILLFAAMALIPALAVGTLSLNPSQVTSADEAETPGVHKNEVISFAAGLCGKDYCDETLRSYLIIARSHVISGGAPTNNNSDKELLSKLEQIYNSEKALYIFYKGSPLAVPYSNTSNGRTYDNSSLPFLKSVASPWDCFGSYEPSAHCEGISLSGINYLCKNGKTAEEAIMWYMPGVELREIK